MDYCELHITNNYTDIMGSGWDWNQTRVVYNFFLVKLVSTLIQVQDTTPGWQKGVNCTFRV